jgi:hypothetical protein
VAQWIAHLTSNQGVAGSSPAMGILFFLTATKKFIGKNFYRKKELIDSKTITRLFARVGLRGGT